MTVRLEKERETRNLRRKFARISLMLEPFSRYWRETLSRRLNLISPLLFIIIIIILGSTALIA